jgi:hypothetical protein
MYSNSFWLRQTLSFLCFLYIYIYININLEGDHTHTDGFHFFSFCYVSVSIHILKMDIKIMFVCEWIFKRLNVSVKRKHRWRMLKSVLFPSLLSSFPIINDRSSTYIASCVFCSTKKKKENVKLWRPQGDGSGRHIAQYN